MSISAYNGNDPPARTMFCKNLMKNISKNSGLYDPVTHQISFLCTILHCAGVSFKFAAVAIAKCGNQFTPLFPQAPWNVAIETHTAKSHCARDVYMHKLWCAETPYNTWIMIKDISMVSIL